MVDKFDKYHILIFLPKAAILSVLNPTVDNAHPHIAGAPFLGDFFRLMQFSVNKIDELYNSEWLLTHIILSNINITTYANYYIKSLIEKW